MAETLQDATAESVRVALKHYHGSGRRALQAAFVTDAGGSAQIFPDGSGTGSQGL